MTNAAALAYSVISSVISLKQAVAMAALLSPAGRPGEQPLLVTGHHCAAHFQESLQTDGCRAPCLDPGLAFGVSPGCWLLAAPQPVIYPSDELRENARKGQACAKESHKAEFGFVLVCRFA